MEKSSQIILVTFVLGLAVALQALWIEESPTPPEIEVYWGIMTKPSPGRKGAWIHVLNLGGEVVDYVHVEMKTESPTIYMEVLQRLLKGAAREEDRGDVYERRITKELLSQRIYYNITDLCPSEQHHFYLHFLTEDRYT